MRLPRGLCWAIAAVLALAAPPRAFTQAADAAADDVADEARRLIASGVAASSEGRLPAAARDFAKAAALRPPDGLEANARLLQAQALAAMARFEDAVVVLDAFLKLDPNGPDAFKALILRGQALVGASALTPHFQEAAVSFSMALETEGTTPNDRALAALNLADALLRMDDAEGAAKAIGRLGRRERDALARLAARERNPRLAGIAR